jgi:cellobiose phosphorylase
MNYGYFDDAAREYVITRPDTPLPWINYLGSEAYFGLISNTAGGYSFYRDARLRRITRYRYNQVPFDTGGRYLYLRDDASGRFWSPSWQPTRTPLDSYTCRHGLGYTVISGAAYGIEASTRYFVPLGANLEVWRTHVTNRRETAAELSLFSAVEFNLWDAWDDQTNFQRNFNTGEVEVEGGVIYHKTEYRERRDHFAYFACSARLPSPKMPSFTKDGIFAPALAGFDTQREAFLGPYRGWDNPIAVERGQSGDSVAHGWSPIGSHHVKLNLQPGETAEVIFVLGYHENPAGEKFDPPASQTINKHTVLPVIQRWLQPETVEAALDALRGRWDELLSILTVHTPDEHVNRMVNIWNAYQVMVTFNLSRSASYFESGVGRGMGFRDSNQDLLGFVQMVPSRARARILDLAATQLESGGAYHQYQPLTKRGNDAVGSGFNDDPLWLVLAVAAYLKETGDGSILAEPVVYENRLGTEQPLGEHLQRCIQYTLDRLGPHGLPLIGRADWNDCLNLNCFSETPGEPFQTTENRGEGAVAESVFIAGQFVLAAKEMAGIAEMVAQGASGLHPSSYYLEAAARMEAAVRAHGWDGAWFLRAYDAFGNKVGSAGCDEGQIFIEPQGMCVMAGIGLEDGLAEQALASVRERLASEHGVVLLQPAFTRYHVELGEITSYPPGYKENASIFCHTNPWIMVAEARLGHGEQALDYYHRICPSAREAISDVHRSEPYVYAQTIAGKDAPSFGEAKNAWLTGTAAWNYVAVTQWILGIRPSHDGLRVAPVVPASWPGFQATRQFRGVTYHIDVRRAGPGNAVALTVDGKAVMGDVVPLPAAGTSQVRVVVAVGDGTPEIPHRIENNE